MHALDAKMRQLALGWGWRQTYRKTLLGTSRAVHHQLTSIGTMPADLLEDQRSPLLQHLHDGRVPVDQLCSSRRVETYLNLLMRFCLPLYGQLLTS
jgi:hypothetical protein